MRVVYAVLCEEARPRPDGRLDLIGVFRSLSATRFPAMQDHMVLAVEIEWSTEDAGDQEFRIDLLDPAQSPTFTISVGTEVWAWDGSGEPPRSVLHMPLPEVRFLVPGTYLFELYLGEAKVPLTPLHLIENPDAV